MKKFKKKYLFSFVTAFLYGNTLDLMMKGVALVPRDRMVFRLVFYILGLFFCAIGVSMFFHTYISPEAYELFVKEMAEHYNKDINKTKTIYDCTSCALAVALSFVFFGFMHFEGVKAGTVVCALINGYTIGKCSLFLETRFEIKDAFSLRRYFV